MTHATTEKLLDNTDLNADGDTGPVKMDYRRSLVRGSKRVPATLSWETYLDVQTVPVVYISENWPA